MKKLFPAVFFIFILVGCQMQDVISDAAYSGDFSNIPLYDPIVRHESIKEIGIWIRENTSYIKLEDVQYPEKTIKTGKGDCKARALLMMDAAYFSLGIKMDLICVDLDSMSRDIVDGGYVNHCMAIYDGIIYEPCGGNVYTGDIGFSYKFESVFK